LRQLDGRLQGSNKDGDHIELYSGTPELHRSKTRPIQIHIELDLEHDFYSYDG
ncbi:unnamed protein product, partial [Heterotrigona itama]